ncbi:hypothetical protein [Shewanella aestuarii]|uniref:Uncharacterized protein n=1 Tax=Shewanella aestuarii TaxID=1028752 RepID=A0A6G9QSB8_9GAMM|nr:hypothetical protein [Shewanella aestuarii]QIR16679.1 hypothetical protein HBH39_19595 [Shewanella aestuarii]
MNTNTAKVINTGSESPLMSVVDKKPAGEFKTVSTIADEFLASNKPKPAPKENALNFTNSKGVACVDKITEEHTAEFKALLTNLTVKLALELGLSVTDVICKVSEDQSTLKIGLNASTVNFFGLDHYGRSYLSHCSSIEFNPAWLGVKFKPNKTEMVITGYDPEGNRLRIFNGTSTLWVREVSFSNIRQYFIQNV